MDKKIYKNLTTIRGISSGSSQQPGQFPYGTNLQGSQKPKENVRAIMGYGATIWRDTNPSDCGEDLDEHW